MVHATIDERLEMPLELCRRIDYIMIRSGIHGPTLTSPIAGAFSPGRLPESGQAIILVL